MTTPVELIRLALRDAGVNGVGQTPNAEDNNDAFSHLNMMLAGWSRRRWLVYHLQELSIVSTGAQSYTVGTGGDISTTRPSMLEKAWFRLLTGSAPGQPIDFPLTILTSFEDYSRIALKSLVSWPQYAFLDSGFPLASIYVWPVPAAGTYSLHVLVKAPLTQFADLTTDINLPPEYMEALLYSLGERLRLSYQLEPDRQLSRLAAAARDAVMSANVQIPLLQMPAGLINGGGDSGAIYDGGFR